MSGKLPTTLNIIRTVTGLALPVRCTVARPGINVGSCSYTDICKDVMQDIANVTSVNCPPKLAEWGIDCNCPFNLPVQKIDGSLDFQISDLSTSIVSFLVSGDFDVTATVNNAANQHVACLRLKFTMQKATL